MAYITNFMDAISMHRVRQDSLESEMLCTVRLQVRIFYDWFLGFRLNTTIFANQIVSQRIDCIIECAMEPCCRSINYKKRSSLKNETNCEMLHNVVFNTSENALEKNSSFHYVYLTNPDKVSLSSRSSSDLKILIKYWFLLFLVHELLNKWVWEVSNSCPL